MQIDPHSGGVFLQILAVAATAATAAMLIISQHIRSRLARVRRRITRDRQAARIVRPWRD